MDWLRSGRLGERGEALRDGGDGTVSATDRIYAIQWAEVWVCLYVASLRVY